MFIGALESALGFEVWLEVWFVYVVEVFVVDAFKDGLDSGLVHLQVLKDPGEDQTGLNSRIVNIDNFIQNMLLVVKSILIIQNVAQFAF